MNKFSKIIFVGMVLSTNVQAQSAPSEITNLVRRISTEHGRLDYIGNDVPKNEAESAEWYRLIVNSVVGCGQACINLGVRYYLGKGVPKNLVQSYKWLSIDVTMGNPDAVKWRNIVASNMTKEQIAEATYEVFYTMPLEPRVQRNATVSSNLSTVQRNAVRSANSYLKMSGFSRQGLIDQLSSEHGEKYTVRDATVAIDGLGVDWRTQAVRSAASYLKMSGFSCKGLIDQLSSEHGEKYTVEQATYGVTMAGIC